MIYEITMPSLGADMEKGRFVEWKVKVGDHVDKDQEIAVIETPKAAVEMDSFKSGKIIEIIAKPDEVYPVGAVLAKMELDFVESTTPIESTGKKGAADIIQTPGTTPPISTSPIPAARPRISPAARKLAEKENVDINKIKGTGPSDAIEIKDVENYLSQQTLKQVDKSSESMISIREAIGRTMARSKKEIPHYYLKAKVIIDGLVKQLDELNSRLEIENRILMPAVLIYLLAKALKKYPDLNGYYENDKFTPHSEINMGMAISLKSGGVIVPAIMGMEGLNLSAVNGALKDLVARTRTGKLKNSELSKGTITITNLGDLGCQEVFGVIFPPQVALIGLGQIRKEPIVDDNNIRAGYVVDVTLSADHRVTDGLLGSRFLQTVNEIFSQFQLSSEEKI